MREAEDHVMKQHWISYGDFGAVVAEGGLRKRSLGDAEALKGIEAGKKEKGEKFDGSGGGKSRWWRVM